MDSCKEANYVYPIYFGEHCNIGDLVLLDQYRSDQVRKLNPYDSQCTDPVAFGESSKINSSTVRQNTATTPTTTEHLESSARELPMDSNIGLVQKYLNNLTNYLYRCSRVSKFFIQCIVDN